MRLEEILPRIDVRTRVKRPHLVPDLEALHDRLRERGHRTSTVEGYMRAAVHVVHCLGSRLRHIDELSSGEIRRLATAHRQPNAHCTYASPAAEANFRSVAVHLLRVMRERRGLTPEPAPTRSSTAVEQLLKELDQHLADVRGLLVSTRARYRRDLRRLLKAKYGAGPVDLDALGAGEVREWVASRASGYRPRTAHALVTALRSLFRYLTFRGEAAGRLAGAVPAVRTSRLSGLPGGLEDEQLARLTGSIDISKPIGLRAHAMVQCLATLGLRAQEVANLRLEDVDWREGIIQLRATKSRRALVLPLPALVGASLAEYLRRGRPSTTDRHLFVRHYYPAGRGLRSSDVTSTIRRAMRRAGLRLSSIGAHVLRHTAATRLLRGGAKMKEIADLLGHRDINSTKIYAKVDWARLAEVALPWPSEAS